MPEKRIAKLERLKSRPEDGGQTLSLFIRPGSRSRPYTWFEPQQVPAFDGDFAYFEMERIKGGWKVLREVPPPPWA